MSLFSILLVHAGVALGAAMGGITVPVIGENVPVMTVSPYTVLGLREGAPESQVKRAFRRLALKHHPDKIKLNFDDLNLDPEELRLKLDALVRQATDKFRSIKKAYHQIRREKELIEIERRRLENGEMPSSEFERFTLDDFWSNLLAFDKPYNKVPLCDVLDRIDSINEAIKELEKKGIGFGGNPLLDEYRKNPGGIAGQLHGLWAVENFYPFQIE